MIASSTSALSISEIQKAVRRPQGCVIVHPMNPVHIMPLVEIVPDSNTSKATVDLAYESMVTVGRTPVVCRKEVPGFVINRLQSAICREAFDMVDRGVVTVEEADKAVMGGILYSKFEVYLDDACGHWEPHMNVADSTQFHCFTPAKTIPYLCGH